MKHSERILGLLNDRHYIDLETGCWIWTGVIREGKYGTIQFKDNGKMWQMYAHRLSWILHREDIPDGMFVCHVCDNPKCINPDHLFLGDKFSNMEDRDNKNRQAKGEKHGRSKLTENDVLEIYKLNNQNYSQSDIANKYGITRAMVNLIINGKNWKYLFNARDTSNECI